MIACKSLPLPLLPSAVISPKAKEAAHVIMEILLLLFIVQLPDDFTVHIALELVWALHLPLLLSFLRHQHKYYVIFEGCMLSLACGGWCIE